MRYKISANIDEMVTYIIKLHLGNMMYFHIQELGNS